MSRFNSSILFVYCHPASFIKSDLEILRKHFFVYPVHVSVNFLETIIGFVKSIQTVDVIFVWFAGFQAFLSVFWAKLFRKKLVVVAGGYDAAYVPEISYGVFTCWWRAAMAIFVYRNADLVLAVSENTRRELQHVKIKRVIVVYNGVDADKFAPKSEKERIILTVGAVNQSSLKKKGLETFVKSAHYLPEERFILVGAHADEDAVRFLNSIADKNVEFLGHVPFDKLLSFYRKSKVYAQLSYHESFGVALAEAMACECVPVVTRRAALPEVVGDCGIYVSYGDAEATAKAIGKALGEEELGKSARERVVKMFSIEERERKLTELIRTLQDGQADLDSKSGTKQDY